MGAPPGQAKPGSFLRGIRGWAAAAVAAGVLVAGNATAADICISQAAKDTFTQCPGGKLEATAGKKPAVSFNSAPQGVNLKKRDDQTKPTPPATSQNDRPARRASQSAGGSLPAAPGHRDPGPREPVQTTPKKTSPDRPKLMRRLAEGYVELEAAATSATRRSRASTDRRRQAEEARRRPKLQEESGRPTRSSSPPARRDQVLRRSWRRSTRSGASR
jgi:hypothetical protein